MIQLFKNYKVFDLNVSGRTPPLPSAPDDREKEIYANRYIGVLILFSTFGFSCLTLSTFRLFSNNIWMIPLFVLLAYTVVYFLISQIINLSSRDFSLKAHKDLVSRWAPRKYPSVDVFLPNCGEPLPVLANTWRGVREMQNWYPGEVNVHCLDDAHSQDVRMLAKKFEFEYHARPDKGWFKKAGNLRYGYNRTHADFIAIFDADFRPRHDFLTELLPYFFADETIGIVQTPQYFGVDNRQNWLERGAGAVQELFYRVVQTSRQGSQGAICVGSNAIYRRSALDDIGGTALIEHSEDVHTGFELRMKGWRLQYLPLVLAKGLCPDELGAFFQQQYRWCMGSMSLLTARKFWDTKLPIMSRICYLSGFMYYIHTAIYAVFLPLIPLTMLLLLPEQIQIANYLLIFPSVIYMHVVFPLWHRVPYGLEAASVRLVYGWAHLVALRDKILSRAMEWQPTGAGMSRKNTRYGLFRAGVVIFNLIPALLWVGAATYHSATASWIDFAPMLALGLYYLALVIKVVVYQKPVEVAQAAQAVEVRQAVPFPKKLWIMANAVSPVPATSLARSIRAVNDLVGELPKPDAEVLKFPYRLSPPAADVRLQLEQGGKNGALRLVRRRA